MVQRKKREDALPFDEWLLHELTVAFFDARKGKRDTVDEFRFEINWEKNLIQLRDDILNGVYKPSRGIAFITRRPVIREIFAAPFRDRVVHHFLFNMVADWWDVRLIRDSYSCRKGKGTLDGIKRLEHHIRAASCNYTKKAYVIKLDIQGYFMSLSRQKLYERIKYGLRRQFHDQPATRNLMEYVWREVIFDDPVSGAKRRGKISDWDMLPKNKSLFNQPPGQGIVIGNLSSQLLSNVYLDQLDKFIRFQLGYKHYGRYVDDFYIVVPEEEYAQAKKDVGIIEWFLKSHLGLVLHPRKRYMQEVHKGVEFLGAVIYPNHKVPSKRFVRNFYEAANLVSAGRKDVDSIVSYLGHSKHLNGKKLAARVFASQGWEYKF